ncbi:MAG: amino acid permease [Hyphomonadaceae bacterium]
MIAARSIGPVRATFLVAGNMIGSGIYLLPATMGAFGSVSLIGWIVTTLGALLLAGVFAALFRLRPDSLGVARQVGDALGRGFGFQTSLLYWTGCWVGNSGIALAAAGYLSAFFPALKETAPLILCAAAIIWIFVFVNFLGARRVADFEGAALLLGLLPILAVAIFGWAAFDAGVFLASWNVTAQSDLQTIPATFALIFWAYLGLESAAVAATVVREPARDVPIATIAGVGIAALIYIAASAAMMGLLPAAELAQSNAPFADAAARWIGPIAALVAAACAVFKACGTLCGWLLVSAEIARCGADAGVLPKAFKEKHAGPPRKNLIIIGALMTLVLVGSAQPSLAQQFGFVIALTSLLFLVVFLYCCAALWQFSAEHPARAGLRALAVGAGIFCVWTILSAPLTQLLLCAGIVAATGLCYALARRGLAPA